MKPKSQLVFVPRCTGKPELLEAVDFGGVEISVETVMCVDTESVWMSFLRRVHSKVRGGLEVFEQARCV